MKRISLYLSFCLLISCNYFNAKKVSSESILEDELKTFNWNEVDTYPTFKACDSVTSNDLKRNCFEQTLKKYINVRLSQNRLVTDSDINETVTLKMQISNSGKLTLNEIEIDSVLNKKIPKLDSILIRSLDSLPKIFPAIKRGKPVDTEFILPIVIRTNSN